MSMKELARLPLCAALAVIAIITVIASGREALAAEFKAGDITVKTPWSRATPGGAKVAAGYLVIENSADTPDRLVSATTEIAGRTEIHQMSMTDGMMKMRHVTDGVTVPAHGSVALEPSSYHLMLLDLKRPLKEGETFAGTLTFEKAGTVDVTFEVKGLGAAAPDEGAHQPH
jgi:periplasmic copper chaperone A